MPATETRIPVADIAPGSSWNAGEEHASTGFAPLDLYKKREKIFTRRVSGRFQRLQLYTGWPLLLGYFVTPWINWSGRQAVLFDLPARQFHVFGVTFWPQDFWLLGWLLIVAAFALFTFTSIVGRLWCGYTCPQTVWTAIYMWIEQRTEGLRHQRIRLDRAPWSMEKMLRRGAKHTLWLGFAVLTALTFVGYFVPIRVLTIDLMALAAGGWSLFWVSFFTAATYLNAGYFREQVCIYMCPYARFQSVMYDPDTLIVSYDTRRGEPRGSRRRGVSPTAAGLGDCTDCQLCVQVCPTGIDIRDGLQYECIGCARCIDACDEVMARMNYAPGLISYTTETRLRGLPSRIFRLRVLGYAVALVMMASLLAYMVVSRPLLALEVVRERGELYQLIDAVHVRNGFALQIHNKSQKPMTLTLTVSEPSGELIRFDGPEFVVADAGAAIDLPIGIVRELGTLPAPISNLTFTICADDLCIARINRFFAPD